jgi:hypothetical protein
MAINHRSIEQSSQSNRAEEVVVMQAEESNPKKSFEKTAGKPSVQKKRTRREIIIRIIEYLVNTP